MARSKKLSFAVGNTLVYPGYGVGVVEGIEERTINGVSRSFCVLVVKESDSQSRVMIPVDNVSEVRLRQPSSKAAAKRALAFLSGGELDIQHSWRERYAAHGDMLTQGDLDSVARVLKALYLLNDKKPLSFREKKMYQKALQLFTFEVAEILGRDHEAVEANVLKRLSR